MRLLPRSGTGGKIHWPVSGSLRPCTEQPGLGDPDADEDEGGGQAHQLPDEIENVLVGLAVSLSLVTSSITISLGAVVETSVLDCADQVFQPHALVQVAVEMQDPLAEGDRVALTGVRT